MAVRGIRGRYQRGCRYAGSDCGSHHGTPAGDPPRQSDRTVRRDRLGDFHHHERPDVELSCRGSSINRHAPSAALVRERNSCSQQPGPLHSHLVASQHGQEAGRHRPRLSERSPTAAAGREERLNSQFGCSRGPTACWAARMRHYGSSGRSVPRIASFSFQSISASRPVCRCSSNDIPSSSIWSAIESNGLAVNSAGKRAFRRS